jgi:crotonobetainyl-CoA:carnitine CoA-transferase CaiB-like acyl-CoA transferase
MNKTLSALRNIRVLDLSRVLAAPYCTQLLGDFGAEVIKVEQPAIGDGTRQWGPPFVGEHSAYFLSVNRNKKSVTVDFKTEAGASLIKELAAKCDVLIENFLPGTLARVGLDYDSLHVLNPGLIFCSVTGYGQTGPYKDRPGYDFVIQAQGGLMSITGEPEGEPMKVGVAIADITTGLFAANAILAALHHREHTGQGQHIYVALLDAQVSWLANVAHNYLAGEVPQRYGNAHASIVPYQTFETSDGYFAIAVGSDAQFKRLCLCAGCTALWDDARFQTNPGRVQHRDELIALLQTVFRSRSTSEWSALLIENDIPCSPINDIPTILNDPHVLAREMVQEVDGVRLLGPVAKLSETPARLQSAPPRLGQHTKQVLRELLGKGDEEIARLRESGVI